MSFAPTKKSKPFCCDFLKQRPENNKKIKQRSKINFQLQVLQKKMFLCADNYDEGYFDFKCLPGGKLRMPEDGSPLDWWVTMSDCIASSQFAVSSVCLGDEIGLFLSVFASTLERREPICCLHLHHLNCMTNQISLQVRHLRYRVREPSRVHSHRLVSFFVLIIFVKLIMFKRHLALARNHYVLKTVQIKF